MARKRLELRKAYGLTLHEEENLAAANDQGETLTQLARQLTKDLPARTAHQRPATPPKPSTLTYPRRQRQDRRRNHRH